MKIWSKNVKKMVLTYLHVRILKFPLKKWRFKPEKMVNDQDPTNEREFHHEMV
jgi:hypothetical protein